MKNAGFKYFLAIALSTLLVQACAKKDNSLRARQTQTAEEKAKAEAAAKAAGKEIPAVQDPAASTQDKCVSEISFEAWGDGSDIKIDDIITGSKGTLVLNETVSFIAIQKDGKSIGEIQLRGSQFDAPEKLTEATANKGFISCNSLKLTDKEEYSISSLTLPNSIETEDGKVTVSRSETMKLSKAAFTNTSSLKTVATDLKTIFANLGKATDVKVLANRNADQGVTLKVQYKMTDKDGLAMSKTIEAKYILKTSAGSRGEVTEPTSEIKADTVK